MEITSPGNATLEPRFMCVVFQYSDSNGARQTIESLARRTDDVNTNPYLVRKSVRTNSAAISRWRGACLNRVPEEKEFEKTFR